MRGTESLATTVPGKEFLFNLFSFQKKEKKKIRNEVKQIGVSK